MWSWLNFKLWWKTDVKSFVLKNNFTTFNQVRNLPFWPFLIIFYLLWPLWSLKYFFWYVYIKSFILTSNILSFCDFEIWSLLISNKQTYIGWTGWPRNSGPRKFNFGSKAVSWHKKRPLNKTRQWKKNDELN